MAQYLAQTQLSEPHQSSSRQPYQKIGNEIREKVIYDIIFQEQSIKQTAIKYGLKYSTANGIVQTYQQQGRCTKKDKRNKKHYYKRNKILIFINVATGNIEFYQQQTNSSVLIMEQQQGVQQTSNFSKQEQFQSSKECTGEFVYSDLETISKNIFQILRKSENSKENVNNFINNKQSQGQMKLEICKTEEQICPQQIIEKQINLNNGNNEKQESNNKFDGKKENTLINQINSIIKIESQDQFAIQISSKNKNNHNNNLDKKYEKNFLKLLQLWQEQVEQMGKL